MAAGDLDPLERLETGRDAAVLGDGDRPRQPGRGGGRDLQEEVVERDDALPPGVLRTRSGGVLGRDPRLQDVGRGERRHRSGQRRVGEQARRLGDLVVVPAGAVLVGEQHQPAVVDPGVAAGVLEQHQGQQGEEGRLVGAQTEDDADQPDGLAGEVRPEQVRTGAGGVPGREGEVRDLRDGVETLREDGGVGHGERDAGPHDPLLGAGDPGRHGRLGHEEQPCHVCGRDAEHQPEAERGRRLRGERRVRAHQHQPQHVVLDDPAGVGHRHTTLATPDRIGLQERQLAPGHLLGAEPVEHPPPGGGHQPAGGVVGRPGGRPGPLGGLHGIAERVLDEVEAAELREEQGHQPAPLLAHDLLEGRVGPAQRVTSTAGWTWMS